MPQPEALAAAYLRDAERMQLAVRDAARQGFAGLLHEVDGGGAQEQELPRAATGSPPHVDDTAQGSEQSRRAVHFVQHQELVRVDLAVLFDVGDSGEVARAFQVEIDGAAFAHDLVREGGLATWRGPVSTTAGFPSSRRFTSAFRLRSIMYANLTQCAGFAWFCRRTHCRRCRRRSGWRAGRGGEILRAPGSRIPDSSYIQAPAACFLLFSIACGNTAGTDDCTMVPARSELLSRCG